MSVRANLQIDQGSSYEARFTITTSEGVPIDVSSYTGTGQMRKHYTSTNAFSFSVDANTSGANGIISITMDANTTTDIVPGRYVYDIELVANGITSRILEGQVKVTPEVTK